MQIDELLQDRRILDLEEDFDLNQGEGSEVAWEGGSVVRKKRVLKKAPEAPKRFKSAYICYVMEKMDEMKQSLDGDVKVTELMKKLALMWKNLPAPERKVYEEIAEADKARYFQELSTYSGPMQVPNKRRKKNPCAPKRAMSAFLSYSQEMRPQIRCEFPGMKNADISVILAQRWKAASEEEKRPHLERERWDRQQYYKDLAVWKAAEEERLREEEAERKRQCTRTTIDFLNLPEQLHWGTSSSGSNSGAGSGTASGSDKGSQDGSSENADTPGGEHKGESNNSGGGEGRGGKGHNSRRRRRDGVQQSQLQQWQESGPSAGEDAEGAAAVGSGYGRGEGTRITRAAANGHHKKNTINSAAGAMNVSDGSAGHTTSSSGSSGTSSKSSKISGSQASTSDGGGNLQVLSSSAGSGSGSGDSGSGDSGSGSGRESRASPSVGDDGGAGLSDRVHAGLSAFVSFMDRDDQQEANGGVGGGQAPYYARPSSSRYQHHQHHQQQAPPPGSSSSRHKGSSRHSSRRGQVTPPPQALPPLPPMQPAHYFPAMPMPQHAYGYPTHLPPQHYQQQQQPGKGPHTTASLTNGKTDGSSASAMLERVQSADFDFWSFLTAPSPAPASHASSAGSENGDQNGEFTSVSESLPPAAPTGPSAVAGGGPREARESNGRGGSNREIGLMRTLYTLHTSGLYDNVGQGGGGGGGGKVSSSDGKGASNGAPTSAVTFASALPPGWH